MTSVCLTSDWLFHSTHIGCSVSSQHAPVITLEGIVILRVENASALPTQRETCATGVRQDTGVTTPQRGARYTKIQTHRHTHRHTHTHTHTNIFIPLQPCSCSAAGSSTPQCNPTNGQCWCREEFAGMSCDQCAPGYHGYPACSACGCDMVGTDEKFCNTTLHVCDCQHSGQCVCKVTHCVCVCVCQVKVRLGFDGPI